MVDIVKFMDKYKWEYMKVTMKSPIRFTNIDKSFKEIIIAYDKLNKDLFMKYLEKDKISLVLLNGKDLKSGEDKIPILYGEINDKI